MGEDYNKDSSLFFCSQLKLVKGVFMFQFPPMLPSPTSAEETWERLHRVIRYKDFSRMDYRPSVFTHTKRLRAVVKHVAAEAESVFFLENFDTQKALAIVDVHDWPEVITDDVSIVAQDHMTPAEKAERDRRDRIAIDMLSESMPTTYMGYGLRQLLLHAHHKDCLEAKLVKWLDWMDAICEILHELLAGNRSFIRAIIRSSAGADVVRKKFPELKPLWERGSSEILRVDFGKHDVSYVDASLYDHVEDGHTRESIEIPTDIPYYNVWRSAVKEDLGEYGIASLIEKKERKGFRRPALALVS